MNKCITCEKKYVGAGGLARHYKLNPSHAKNEDSQDGIDTFNLLCTVSFFLAQVQGAPETAWFELCA